ncbi:pyochelin biosynthetic protein PchC [Micromonospora sp. Llam0]|uniref:thioesterase II family protein n=1 Tax=Micromonospora sp. Llam0 TaxID=2485143 RepID=UPI000F471523|nr:alpha/beta fold hydrolase [Micromonospora sp. Llam0]ROO59770.1 pyochelin biosynthetic protein PchC [Micromonospora sp. Llam0]
MNAATLGQWLRCYRRRPAAAVRLVCFPHAGGGAGSFRAWDALLPSSVELVCVQYPGREDRFADPLVDDMSALTAPVADAVARLTDRPYLVFGHSMGTAVAYETVQRLRGLGVRQPQWLFVSGRPAPGDVVGGEVHRRDDDGLCAELNRLGGTHDEVLADPELRRAVLGYVRNDYRLIETYRPVPAAPLDCPIMVLRGDDDPELDDRQATGWGRLTRGRLDVRTFPGDHFYLVPQRDAVVSAILAKLDPVLTRTSAAWPSMP